jgi:flagellar protein FliO/FliZ
MEFDDYLRFILALIFVIGLIGIFAALARRYGFGYRRPQIKGASRRLSLVEVMPVDTKRRLVLVRRDDTEHLILLGTTEDLLVEAGIEAQSFAATLSATDTESLPVAPAPAEPRA